MAEVGRMLTPEEVAQRLGVARLTVYSWIRTGVLPATRLGRRILRIREADLEGFLARGVTG